MAAFIEFNKGIMKMPLPWRLWLMLLITVNFAIPLFFLNRREAQFTVGPVVCGSEHAGAESGSIGAVAFLAAKTTNTRLFEQCGILLGSGYPIAAP